LGSIGLGETTALGCLWGSFTRLGGSFWGRAENNITKSASDSMGASLCAERLGIPSFATGAPVTTFHTLGAILALG
jgi:hypothetical protein